MDKMKLYNRVIDAYGIDAQKWMLVEEFGELLNAFSKLRRQRAEREDVITELADVHIMVEQMAVFFGWDEFQKERKKKMQRLRMRLKLAHPKIR